MASEAYKPTLMERIHEHRLAITATAVPLVTVGAASAAIDFSNISALLQAVVTLIPDFMDLVIGIAPLVVTIAIVGFILAFLDKILEMLKFR